MNEQFSTDRTPLLFISDAPRPSSPSFVTSPPSLLSNTNATTFPLSPPYHHTALTFSSPPSTLHSSSYYYSSPASPHSHSHTSKGGWTINFTYRAVMTLVVCLLLALLVLVTCHMLAPSHVSLFTVLSRMRPHFGHSSQLLAPAFAQDGAASGMRGILSLQAAAHDGERMAASVTPPQSGLAIDERRQRQLGILASYLSVSGQRFTPPPNSANSLGFLVTATRFWCTKESDLTPLSAFLVSASHYSDVILIGLNIEADQCSTADWLKREGWGESVHVVPIVPWLSVTGALNSLLLYASRLSFSRILYQSVEITATVAAINSLLSHLDHRTLVVGACLVPYHSCPTVQPTASAAYAVISGVNNPWNTLAVWHIPSLLKTGFLMVSDSGREGASEGQEEGPTIALLQWMARRWEDKADHAALDKPSTGSVQPPSRDATEDEVAAAMRCEAKLITLRPDAVRWAAVEGVARQAYVERKLKSKRERYEEQMERLGIEKGVVRFIVEQGSDVEAAALKPAAPSEEVGVSRRSIPIGH